ncbi:hypothetical protein [Desulfocurvus vexinensis]|uniref:hypothetical protein n=1 Tax=Desulfocurvus vexinensis TaxID=399548 RepID=UPI0012EBE3BA|nr:hypothetical protein [Desulfocurvus vexinensis]
MGKISDFFGKLRDELFGDSKADVGKKPIDSDAHQIVDSSTDPLATSRRDSSELLRPQREPYFIQIGYDFGTSFSKCVYREVYKDKAWVFCPGCYNDKEKPFLIPSAVLFQNGELARHTDSQIQYPNNGLYHLKFAIEKIASGDINAPVLNPYRSALNGMGGLHLAEFVEKCAVFFLGSSLGEIQQDAKSRFPDFGDNPADQFAVNLAIPVADASVPKIQGTYERILKKAWSIAPSLTREARVKLHHIDEMLEDASRSIDICMLDDLCFVYPEVSANVQAFIRSPASSPDPRTIYFFSDTGAGTVDQSVFTYTKQLNYFSANVFPIGSSHIERLACGSNVSTKQLDYWRSKKETGDGSPNLTQAKNAIENKLSHYSHSQTIKETQRHLPKGNGVAPVPTMKKHIRIIFGGGGHQDNPYKKGVVGAFSDFFHPEQHQPRITAIQTPGDLELAVHQQSWISRLYVAYGLSFLKADLVGNRYPKQTALKQKSTKKDMVMCSCRGISPDCPRCSGLGMYRE